MPSGCLASERSGRPLGSGRGVARNGSDGRRTPLIRSARRGVTSGSAEEEKVFVIGIDPHRGSHTATVLDDKEVVVDELHLVADRQQIDRLLSFAVP